MEIEYCHETDENGKVLQFNDTSIEDFIVEKYAIVYTPLDESVTKTRTLLLQLTLLLGSKLLSPRQQEVFFGRFMHEQGDFAIRPVNQNRVTYFAAARKKIRTWIGDSNIKDAETLAKLIRKSKALPKFSVSALQKLRRFKWNPSKLKKQCSKGHARVPNNLTKGGACRICHNKNVLKKYHKKKLQPPPKVKYGRQKRRRIL